MEVGTCSLFWCHCGREPFPPGSLVTPPLLAPEPLGPSPPERGHARTRHLDQSPGGLEACKQNEIVPRVCKEQLPLVATVTVRGETREGCQRPAAFAEGHVASSREREEIF